MPRLHRLYKLDIFFSILERDRNRSYHRDRIYRGADMEALIGALGFIVAILPGIFLLWLGMRYSEPD